MMPNAATNLEGAPEGVGFAAALSASLSLTIPGTDASSGPVLLDHMLPSVTDGTKGGSDASGQLSKRTDYPQPLGTDKSLPLKKPIKPSDDAPSDVRDATHVVQQTLVANTAMFSLSQPPFFSTDGSGASSPIPTTASAAITSSSEQRPLPTTAEPENIPTQPEGLPVAPMGLPDIAMPNQMDAKNGTIGSIQSQGLQMRSSGQDTNPAPSNESVAPRMQLRTLDRRDAVPYYASGRSVVSEIGNSDQSVAASRDNTKRISYACLNEAVINKLSSTQNDPALLAPPIPEGFSVCQKVAEPQAIQEPEAASSLTLAAISVETSTTLKLPNDSAHRIEAEGSSTTASLVAPLNPAEAIDLSTNIDSASSSPEDNSPDNGGKNTANHGLSSTTDRKAGNLASSPAESGSAEPPKFELTASGPATQRIAANLSPAQTSNEVSGDGNSPDTLIAPQLKGGVQSEAAKASNGDGQRQPTLVQSAQLVSQIGKSDVKIAIQGEQFGAVELHAKVAGDQVSASITVEHHETHAFLSGDLPVLHQLLNERQLRVSEIVLLHDSLSSRSSSDDGPPAKREETSPQQTTNASGNGSEGPSFVTRAASTGAAEIGIFDSKGRLSVRA